MNFSLLSCTTPPLTKSEVKEKSRSEKWIFKDLTRDFSFYVMGSKTTFFSPEEYRVQKSAKTATKRIILIARQANIWHFSKI